MNMGAILLAVAVGLAVLGFGALVLMFTARVGEKRVERRFVGASAAEDGGNRPRARSAWITGMSEGGERIDEMFKGQDETRVLLAQAGLRTAQARAFFYALQFGVPVVCGGIGVLVLVAYGFARAGSLGPLLVLLAVILSLLAPRYLLRRWARRRRERMEQEIPLFINLLLLLFEAGLNLRQALSSLVNDGRQTLPTVADELAPMLRQIEAGADAQQVLGERGKLLAIDDLDTVFGILRQVERYGGEIREPLVETLENLQAKRSMALREEVNILSGKMTVVLVTCFFPPLLIFIAGPAFVTVGQTLSNL